MTAQRPRILIVDDEVAILTALQLAFQDEDWHIEVVTSAELAYARFREGSFDLLLVDKNLPDSDGVELIRRIRRDDDDVRFVMITGFASRSSAVETANLGIDAYLEKPFRDVFAVARTVRGVLSRRRPTVAKRLSRLFAGKPSGTSSGKPADTSASKPAPTKPPAANVSAKSTGPLRVLIASAEQRTQKQIARHIGGNRNRLFFAQSSEQVMSILTKDEPDAVIVHGALDVVRLVHQVREANPETAIMIASESLDLESVKQLISLQINAVIEQPIDNPSFEVRVTQLLKVLRKQVRDDGAGR
jgi:DNA-binding response OmpR family regulator